MKRKIKGGILIKYLSPPAPPAHQMSPGTTRSPNVFFHFIFQFFSGTIFADFLQDYLYQGEKKSRRITKTMAHKHRLNGYQQDF